VYVTATPYVITATPEGNIPTNTPASFITNTPVSTDIVVTETPTPTATTTEEETPTREVNAQFRISYNINARAVDDWSRLWAHVEITRPASLLFMDGLLEACQAMQRLPDTIVIHRNYSAAEGDEWQFRNAGEWVAQWDNENKGLPVECRGMVRYSTNEPSFGDVGAWIQSEIDLMREAQGKGIRVMVGNLGVGRLPDWAVEGGLFDEWLIAVVDGGHIIGAHEYTQPVLVNGIGLYSREQMTSAEAMHPRNWVAAAEIAYLPFTSQSLDELDPITSPFGVYEQALAAENAPVVAQSSTSCGRLPAYWHILRTTWLLLRAECIGIDTDDITIINGEGLWDRTDDLNIPGVIEPIKDLERDFGVPRYFRDMRGVNSYVNLWNAWYPFWTTSESIVCQLVWWDAIAPSAYNSVNIFAWNRNRDWWSFDMSGAEGDYLYEVHRHLEYWSQGGDMHEICGDYAWAA
jgi:hypothetical protein